MLKNQKPDKKHSKPIAVAAEVIIELIPNTDKVESALNQLGNNDGSTDIIKQGNEELKKRKALIDQNTAASNKEAASIATIGKNIGKVSAEAIKLGASLNKGVTEGIADALAQAGVSTTEFTKALEESGMTMEQYIATIEAGVKATTESQGAEESLRAEKKRLQAEIAKLILAGQQESEMFLELVSRAGEIDDAMSDAADTIRRTGSDTRNLDNLITVAQGVTAGFTVATSAAALFGDESEDTQKALLKVNAAMSLLNGLQQIQTILRSEDNKALVVRIANQIRTNAALLIENGLQSNSTVVRIAATAAQWGLNAAMAANPIGILIVGITALIGLMYAYANSANETAAAQAKLNAILQSSQEGLEAEIATYERSSKLRIAQLQNIGAKQSEINKEELRSSLLIKEAKENEIKSIEAGLKATSKLDIDRKEALNTIKNLNKEVANEDNEIQIKKLELQKQIKDENKKAADESVKNAKEAREKALQTLQQQVNDRKALAELSLLYARKGSEDELAAKIKVIQAEKDVQLANDKLTANQRKLIVEKSEKEIADLKKQTVLDSAKDERTIELLKAQNRLAGFLEGSKQYDDAKKAELQAQAELDKLSVQQSSDSEELKYQKILLIQNNLNKAYDDINRSRFEKERQGYEHHLNVLNDVALRQAQNKANDPRLNETEQFKAQQDILELRLQQAEQKRTEIHRRALNDRSYADSQYADDLLSNAQDIADAEFDIQAANTERILQLRTQVLNTIFSLSKQFSDDFFASEKAQRDAALQQEIDNLNTRKDKTLETVNLTAAQKSAIEKKYAAEEKALRKKAAEDEKRAKINQALINGALAVTNILATRPKFDLGVGDAIMIGAALASTALQVAAISKTPTGYATGTENASKGWRWVGEKGPELMWFKGGEKVKTNKESMSIAEQWNKKLSSSIPHNTDLSNYSIGSGGDIQLDYDRIGKAVADNMPEQTTIVQVDGIKEIIFRRNSVIEYKNARKSTV